MYILQIIIINCRIELNQYHVFLQGLKEETVTGYINKKLPKELLLRYFSL